MSEPQRLTPLRYLALAAAAAVALLGLRTVGWGYDDLAGFLAAPPRLIAAVGWLAMALVTPLLLPSRLLSRGRADRLVNESPRHGRFPVLTVGGAILLVAQLVPAWCDRRELWQFGGEAWRWLGLVLNLTGGALAIWAPYCLGRNFSPWVTIQEGHTLVTTGAYRWIRHPRYLGLILDTVGLALLHRSWPGLLVGFGTAVMLCWRISYEEALLAGEFGDEWTAYAAGTRRLVPRVW